MKYLRKKANGLWEARKTFEGVRYSFYGRTKEICYQKLKKALNEYKYHHKLPKPKLKKEKTKAEENTFKLYEVSIKWAETYKKNFVSENTYKDIVRKFKSLKNSKIDISIKRLNTNLIQEYLNEIKASRNKEIFITYLNACLKRVCKQLKISNPMDDIQKEPKINSIRKPFTYAEQVKILESIKGTDIEDAILIYLFTGMRKNELNHKSIKNDLQEDETLKIKCEKKRGNTIQYRFVDITSKTRILIEKAKLYNPSTISDKFRLILDNLRIPKGYGIHTLRHTFTTNHFYLGTPDKYLQEWLGHENVAITRKHYMSIDRSLSKEKILSLYQDYYYVVR